MVQWFPGASADIIITAFELLVSLKLFTGRFDARVVQAAVQDRLSGKVRKREGKRGEERRERGEGRRERGEGGEERGERGEGVGRGRRLEAWLAQCTVSVIASAGQYGCGH